MNIRQAMGMILKSVGSDLDAQDETVKLSDMVTEICGQFEGTEELTKKRDRVITNNKKRADRLGKRLDNANQTIHVLRRSMHTLNVKLYESEEIGMKILAELEQAKSANRRLIDAHKESLSQCLQAITQRNEALDALAYQQQDKERLEGNLEDAYGKLNDTCDELDTVRADKNRLVKEIGTKYQKARADLSVAQSEAGGYRQAHGLIERGLNEIYKELTPMTAMAVSALVRSARDLYIEPEE